MQNGKQNSENTYLRVIYDTQKEERSDNKRFLKTRLMRVNVLFYPPRPEIGIYRD
jgi:hypothetical protein